MTWISCLITLPLVHFLFFFFFFDPYLTTRYSTMHVSNPLFDFTILFCSPFSCTLMIHPFLFYSDLLKTKEHLISFFPLLSCVH